jgi:hypothetical protein
MEKEKNLNKYGQSFQLVVLSLFFRDKAFTARIKDILLAEYFDNKYTQTIYQMGLDYLEKYYTFPSEDKVFDVLKTIIETTKNITAKLYLGYLENIKNVDLSSSKFVKEEIEKFCFTKYALIKIEEQKNNIELGKFNDAKKIALTTYIPINTHYTELRLTADFKVVLQPEQIHRAIPSLFQTFNKKSKGGPGAGDLAIVVAQSSFGKTAYLTALARYLATIGKKVIYFSLETDRHQLMARALAGLVNIEQEQLKDHPKLIENKIKEIEKNKGEILFLELKATTARIESLRLILEEKKTTGFFPDVIMVDGLNQLKLPRGIRNNDNNDKFEWLSEELRDWGKEEQLPVWASFQTNRGGFNVEYADEQNIGKAIEVYQNCDWMLLFTQSIPMYEKGECYVQLLKNRLGAKGITLLVNYDPNKGIFTEIRELPRTELLNKKQIKEMRQGLEKIKKVVQEIKEKV